MSVRPDLLDKAALCLVGSLSDLVALKLARALVESIETTNTAEDLDAASRHLFNATTALETEAERELLEAITEAHPLAQQEGET